MLLSIFCCPTCLYAYLTTLRLAPNKTTKGVRLNVLADLAKDILKLLQSIRSILAVPFLASRSVCPFMSISPQTITDPAPNLEC